MSEDREQAWDAYPSGLKVLAVDDDPLCLKVVEQMLRRCNYEVRTAENGREALRQLRDKGVQIDLVLSDVYMPDMDGFKLLETIGLELDLPVIMMSSNGETPVVLRGVTHGAVDFLIKPVRIEELRNVWQHVVRRRKDQVQNSKEGSGEEEVVDGNRQDKKRKENAGREGEGDHTSTKKPRVVWSVEMHQQFVNAVNSLGIDKAVPKRILDLMSVEGLTRENVASHLQKYRLYLKRVAGVAVQPSGRGGKGGQAAAAAAAAAAQPLEQPQQAAYGPLMVPTGLPGCVPEEELKRQLQLQHLGHARGPVGAQPLYIKQEAMPGPGLMPLIVPTLPYSNGNGLADGLPAPDYGPAIPGVGNQDSGGAGVGPSGLLPMHSGTFDASSLGAPSHQFGPETTASLVYPPEPLLPPHAPVTPLGLPPDGLGGVGVGGPEPSHGGLGGPLGPEGGLSNGHTDQEMENFINIFLEPQPNE